MPFTDLSSTLDPLSSPEEWQYVTVAGVRSPGMAKVAEAKRSSTWDVKRGKGAKGATITYTGDEPAQFRVTLRFWLSSHFAAWDAFRKLLKYDPTKKTISAVDISYPSLDQLDITSVVCKTIGAVEPIDEGGYYQVEFELIEYRPPPKKSAVGTPDTSKAGQGNGNGQLQVGLPPDPIAQAKQAEIEKLLKQAQAP